MLLYGKRHGKYRVLYAIRGDTVHVAYCTYTRHGRAWRMNWSRGRGTNQSLCIEGIGLAMALINSHIPLRNYNGSNKEERKGGERYHLHAGNCQMVADLLTFCVPEDVEYLTGEAERRTKAFFNCRRKKIRRNIVKWIPIRGNQPGTKGCPDGVTAVVDVTAFVMSAVLVFLWAWSQNAAYAAVGNVCVGRWWFELV